MQVEHGRHANVPMELPGENAIVYGFLWLFAILLALMTSRHAMFGDEAQAWLIARDSGNLLELAQHLRYEGHPALWYLLLYLPAHLSASLVWMQAVNYVLALAMAWMVLTERRLSLAMRIMAVFGVFVFFHMGLMARNYMLAAVLLVGASRCLLADRPRHWLAMVLLALAVNAHVFAIPVAAGIFVWFYWLDPEPSLRVAAGRLREWRFWISAALLGVALLVCYFTVRPAPDGATPEYNFPGASWLDYLVIGTGRLWSYFVPFIPQMLAEPLREKLIPELHPSMVAAVLSVALWLLIVSSLATPRSRWFFVSTSLAWLATVWATVHAPSPHHISILFVVLLIALMLNVPEKGERPWLPFRYAQSVLVVLLAMQMAMSIEYSVLAWFHPFSGAEATAEWLERAGLTERPLVVEPDYAASVVLARTGVRSAYFPTCRCQGPFVVFRQGRDDTRQVTEEEIEAIKRESGMTPVVLSHWPLSVDSLQQMGLRPLYRSPHGFFWPYEDMYVYGDNGLPKTESSAALTGARPGQNRVGCCPDRKTGGGIGAAIPTCSSAAGAHLVRRDAIRSSSSCRVRQQKRR
jgi:hypothetical protein